MIVIIDPMFYLAAIGQVNSALLETDLSFTKSSLHKPVVSLQ